MNTLELEDVHVRFGNVHALRGVNVSLRRGAVTMLIGPNGAGKTTLARVVLGLVRADRGIMKIDGVAANVDASLKQQLGYLPEAVAFSENLTALQVLRFFAWARGVKRRRVGAALERVGLAHAARRRVRGYSRGMRQRLGLAVAILAEPPLLILDEPSGGLDSEGLAVLWSILDEWREAERLVMMSSHQLALMERRVDDVRVFDKGRIVAGGSPDELRDQAGLPHHVAFELAPGDAAASFVAEIRDWPAGEVDVKNGTAMVSVPADSLLDLMDISGRHSGAAVGLRIQEPTLDMVYEALLRNAAPQAQARTVESAS